MKIAGVIDAEGVRLHVDVDVPDDQDEVYVTNVHPNCFVVPYERWRVEFLGLPLETVEKLQKQGILFLGQLERENGKGVIGLDEELANAVNGALKKLEEMALIFGGVDGYQERTLAAITTPPKEPDQKVKPELSLDEDIRVVGLRKEQEESLFKNRKIKTLSDLVLLGRSRLLMTDKMDDRGIEEIEATLRKAGATLLD